MDLDCKQLRAKFQNKNLCQFEPIEYLRPVVSNLSKAKITFFLIKYCPFKGSMPPSIGHMELLVWMQRADFSEHIQGFKSPGEPLNSSHFHAPNTNSAPTGYRRAPNIISHHYK